MDESYKKYLLDLDNEIITDEVLQSHNLKNWENIIINDDYWKVIKKVHENDELSKEFFEKLDDVQSESYFCFAIACLQRFVQANFTGPEAESNDPIVNYCNSDLFKDVDFSKYLIVDNEEVDINTKLTCLLTAARVTFKNCVYNNLLRNWWLLRSLIIHQKVLDDLSASLYNEAISLENILNQFELEGHEGAELHIELAQLYITFRNIPRTEKHTSASCQALGFKMDLVGKLGKRTKYQMDDKAQLALNVTLEEKEGIKRPKVKDLYVPENLSLNDDVRLENISYTDGDIQLIELPNCEQKLILAIVQQMKFSKPFDELHNEELTPYVNYVLAQKNTWCVRSCALLARCKLEANHKRTKERTLMQCEELISSFKKNEPHPLARVTGVYGSGLQPIWHTEGQYADLMFKMGLIKAALDVYLKISMWEEVIGCYSALNLRHLAAKVIREQLSIKESVNLWCWLGDAEDDESCYEKAWKLSEERSSRAQRHWGSYYYHKRKYKECIPYFEKSVDLNPLQQLVWLRLGYAALQTEEWECAATAYKRYTTLEPDNFEVWNNLAQAHIKLGNKKSAHQALIEALRCNFDNWKVWENLVNVSAAITHLSDLIRAYHRMLDLREKYLNLQVLCILVRGVSQNVNDCEGRPCGSLLPKARELLGRLVAVYPGEGMLWELYAELSPDAQTQVQRLQRAYRGYVKTLNWNKDLDCCMCVLYVCIKLGNAVVNEEISENDPIVDSVRLNLNSAIAAIKKEGYEETTALLDELQEIFEKVIAKKTQKSL